MNGGPLGEGNPLVRDLAALGIVEPGGVPIPDAPEDEVGWEKLAESQFPDVPLNLNPGTLGNPSRAVLDAMARAGRHNARLLPLERLARMRRVREGVRAAAAEIWGCHPEDLALGPGTSAYMSVLSLALAAWCRRSKARPRDDSSIRVLTTDFEHYGGLGAFSNHPCFEVVPLRGDAFRDPAAFAALAEALRPEVFFASQVTWVGHERLPIEGWIRGLREWSPETVIVVDAAQAFGLETPVIEGVDFVVASGHKWVCGPAGTGFLWSSPSARERIGPIFPAGDPLAGLHPSAGFEPRGGLDGTLLEGLGAALGLQLLLGTGLVRARQAFLARWFGARLGMLAGTARAASRGRVSISMCSPAFSLSPGVMCLDVEGGDPYPLYRALMDEGVAVKCIKTELQDGSRLCRLRIGIPFHETIRRLERVAAVFARCLEEWCAAGGIERSVGEGTADERRPLPRGGCV